MKRFETYQYWRNIIILMIIGILLLFALSSCGTTKHCPSDSGWKFNKIKSLIHE
tara:strand:- start:2863 stop:3024 length:162 start_codon:yes stop_codon:yes gene_type:complete